MKKILIILFLLLRWIYGFSDNIHDSIVNLINETENKERKCKLLLELGNNDNSASSLSYSRKALKMSIEIQNSALIADSYYRIGEIFYFMDMGDSAMQYLLNSYKISRQANYSKIINASLNEIAITYAKFNDFENALKYCDSAFYSATKTHDTIHIARSLYIKGAAYVLQKNYDKALDLLIEANILSKSKNGYYKSYIGHAYLGLKEFEKARIYSDSALNIFLFEEDLNGQGEAYKLLGSIYSESEDYPNSIFYYKSALKVFSELNSIYDLQLVHKSLYEIYYQIGDLKKALEEHILFFQYYDSLQINSKVTEVKMEFDKKERELAFEKENAIQIANQLVLEERGKRQFIIIVFALVFMFIFVILIIIILRRYRITQQQKKIIEVQKQEIEDSIKYAQRIQIAILPIDTFTESILGEYFIIFKPKDVVSGDFYWVTQTDEWTVVTVADCTGHGVPGAFMSMLGVSFLNEIARKKDVTNTAEILNHLRASVIDALKQTGESGSQKDGMDMSIVAIHKDRKRIFWSGANNPIWIIRQTVLDSAQENNSDIVEEIKADKMPVGIHVKMEPFKNHEIAIEKGDRLYLFSDGYPDQFGGPKGKKFLYKRFKTILTETAYLTMKEQGEYIEKEIDNWMTGYETKYEQIDDITVVGLKI